ncbi:hypothetical protein D3C71_910050 [compost metagenome]
MGTHFVGLLQNERNAKVKRLKAIPQLRRQHITCAGGVVSIVTRSACQAFVKKLVIERLKRRVLHDGEHVDQTAWLLPGVDALAVLAFQVGIFVIAPHQAQASANGLLQQNLRLAASQWHDDADVVHIKTLAQHQHAHDHARCRVAVHTEQALAHGCPVFFTQFRFFAGIDGHDLVFAQPLLLLQKGGYQRRHRGVLAHH